MESRLLAGSATEYTAVWASPDAQPAEAETPC